MKSTGVTRPVDELGRLVLPMELRRSMDIKAKDKKTGEGDTLEIFTEGDMIILKKYSRGCTFCGEGKDVVDFKGRCICSGCMKELRRNKK